MFKSRLNRTMVGVVALAAVAFLASGIPDDEGTDAAIGWWSFVALALAFIVLTGIAVVRALRGRGREADTVLR